MSEHFVQDEADFVIVGTGAGGATAARVLSAAGFSVVMLEEGPLLRKKDRPTELVEAMARTFRDFGAQTTSGIHPIPVLQGRLVGGSTAINSGIIWRLPDDVRAEWTERFGLGELVEEQALAAAFERIEEELEIVETQAEVLGNNAGKMAEASRVLGLPGRPIVRNAKRCKGSARCLQGCPTEARQSMDVSYVPRAMQDGARLHVMCRAERVIIERGRAVGVEGSVLDESTRKKRGKFRVRAKRAVIVAASAIYTPVLLRRSGLRGLVGDRFQAHPGAAVLGRFDESIEMGFGATQGYEVPMRERGYKIESISLPPEMMGARIPGAGAEWQERIASLGSFAQWAAQVRMRAMGKVRPLWNGDAAIHYKPLPEDMEKLRDGVQLMCRMMFAAGAKEVYPGMAGRPAILTRVEDVDLLKAGSATPADFHMMASHLFGTACAARDPRMGVVNERLESHDVKALYVMDASVFPTNLGVNPQHSIMAVVWRGAEMLANASGAVRAVTAAE